MSSVPSTSGLTPPIALHIVNPSISGFPTCSASTPFIQSFYMGAEKLLPQPLPLTTMTTTVFQPMSDPGPVNKRPQLSDDVRQRQNQPKMPWTSNWHCWVTLRQGWKALLENAIQDVKRNPTRGISSRWTTYKRYKMQLPMPSRTCYFFFIFSSPCPMSWASVLHPCIYTFGQFLVFSCPVGEKVW